MSHIGPARTSRAQNCMFNGKPAGGQAELTPPQRRPICQLSPCARFLTQTSPSRGPHVRRLSPAAVRHRQRSLRQEPRAAGRTDQRSRGGTGAALGRGAARQDRGVQAAARRRGGTRRSDSGSIRDRARGRQAHARAAPFRRADDGRHRAASRHDRRDEDRRRQDPRRDVAGLSQRADRERRPRRHGQRLPRQARCRVDGTDLPVPWHDGRMHRP